MKLMSVLLLTVLVQDIVFARECEKLESHAIDSLGFAVDRNFELRAFQLDEKTQATSHVVLQPTKVNRKSATVVEIIMHNLTEKSCVSGQVIIDPVKLCYDASAEPKIEPWRFITCPGPSANCYPGQQSMKRNVISLEAKINQAKIRNSRICGTTELLGDVTVLESTLGEGNYL